MRLYLMRHGEALPAFHPTEKSDYERSLSERGRREAEEAGLYLANELSPILSDWQANPLQVACPVAFFSSPLLRAKQTLAGVMASFFKRVSVPLPEGSIAHELTCITPSHEYHEAFRELNLWLEKPNLPDHWVVVGHQPLIADLFCQLLMGESRCDVVFATGQMACFDLPVFASGAGDCLGTWVPTLDPSGI